MAKFNIDLFRETVSLFDGDVERMDTSDFYCLTSCEVTRESDKAIHVKSDDLPDGRDWIPKSQLGSGGQYLPGYEGDIWISRWLARKIGVI